MNFRNAALFALLALTACAGQTRYFVTNAELLDTSIAKASAQVTENVKAPAGTAAVAVGELRQREDDNDLPQSLIVDRLISEFVKAKLVVVERDRNVLMKLIPEASGKEMSYSIKPRESSPGQPLQFEALVGDKEETQNGLELTRKLTQGQQGQGAVVVGLVPSPEEVANNMTGLFLPETFAKVPTADQLLVFRVIESGVAYGRTSVSGGEDRIRRRALTTLNYRLIDAKTGKVLAAGEAQGAAEDEIPAALKGRLAQPLYHHYVHNMPDLAEVRGQLTRDAGESSLDSRNVALAATLSAILPGTGQLIVNNRYGLGLLNLALEGFFLSLIVADGFDFNAPTVIGLLGLGLNAVESSVQAGLDASEFNDTWGFNARHPVGGSGGGVEGLPAPKGITLKGEF